MRWVSAEPELGSLAKTKKKVLSRFKHREAPYPHLEIHGITINPEPEDCSVLRYDRV